MQVLIAGANGFLGRQLADQCLQNGWQVDVVYNTSPEHIPAGVRNKYSHRELLAGQIPADYDYVFNVAAFIPYGKYNDVDDRLLTSNIELPLFLHRTFPGSKMIFASSVSVYGSTSGNISEDSPKADPTLYGLSKLSGEMITAHHKQYAILRFSSIYGAGMYGGTFIPYIIRDAKTNGVIKLLGEGSRMQNYIHVSDAAAYCIQAALNGNNDIYLGVYPHSYSNKEVAEIISGYTKCKIEYNGIDNSPSFEYNSDHSRNNLRFVPQISIEEGLKEMING